MTKAVCPGSFDPMTLGHLDIFNRSAALFDEVTILVTGNPNKQTGLFSIDERVDLINQVIDQPNIHVDTWAGLLVDYTTENNIDAIVKGLRSSLDYEYELPMAQMNKRLSGIDTVLLLTDEKYGYISSSLCKEVAKYGGDISGFFPEPVGQAVLEKYRA
ncbi:pantetheine-phosphate adenylyltransferase [Corynebacterium ammoniagenes]|uniref:Phosphopantetheine adenylyltransferase n=2 Tax=Corynebacterium ammoniagenes TaxID=1697 RepID=A0AAV5G2T5_CORAM|nr:pantetheine-phosphate adenylyltransferase [Corynebacterium ammoniagenes]APT82778.1 phosphopantetheine adenylyltransferase [Corynebacterium ammoniagenes DSM 20306]AQS73833.1 pantetheine-phosphate adenylyltransferase [Corynebacterium ammoniagenes]GJN42974.1 phosphopantetheine adenylyltransferase [Corynebacterium ammoniagenes]